MSFNKNVWLPGFVLISSWIEITMEDNIDDIIKNIRFTKKLFKNDMCKYINKLLELKETYKIIINLIQSLIIF